MEGSGAGVIELQSQGKNPRRLQVYAAMRSVDDPKTVMTRNSALGRIAFEDRHSATAIGAFSWSVGAVAFQQPDLQAEGDESSRFLPAFKAAWTTGLDEGWGFRLEAQNDARLTPIEQYADEDHTIVNARPQADD